LLAESLNDQSRWGESLATLQLLGPQELEEHANRLYVLRSIGEWHSGVFDTNGSSRTLNELGNLTRTEQQLETCIAAVHAATSILVDDFNVHRAREFLQICRDLSQREATPTQQALIAVEEMALAHLSGQETESMQIETLVARALERGLLHSASATVAGVNLCLGARRLADGDYEGGLQFFQRAYETSRNLGNRKLLARSAGNVALCYDRMGDFDQSLHWAQAGLQAAEDWKDTSRFKLIHLVAWAHAMKGDTSTAVKTLSREKESDRSSNPEWVGQVSLVLSSDLLWALGREKNAIECALRATTGSNCTLLTPLYAGPYCRALARAGVAMRSERESLERILLTARSVGRLDAIDNADIYAAELLLSMRLGIEAGDLPNRLDQSLARLPKAIRPRLIRLGFGEALECAACTPK
jgi:tetratricopeptide (TPR) repeat protein